MKLKSFATSAIVACSLLALVPGSGLAAPQGSGSTGSVASGDDFKVTRSIEGKIAEIKMKDNLVVIEGKNGRRQSLHFTGQTKIASVKAGASNPSMKLADLQTGQKVKAVFRPSDSHVVEMKLLD